VWRARNTANISRFRPLEIGGTIAEINPINLLILKVFLIQIAPGKIIIIEVAPLVKNSPARFTRPRD
jgi:hypothetical protein